MRKEFLALAAAASIAACAEGKQPPPTTEAMGLPKTGAAATMRPPTTPLSLEESCRDIRQKVWHYMTGMENFVAPDIERPVGGSDDKKRIEALSLCRNLCERKAYGNAVQHGRTLAAEQIRQACLKDFGLLAQ